MRNFCRYWIIGVVVLVVASLSVFLVMRNRPLTPGAIVRVQINEGPPAEAEFIRYEKDNKTRVARVRLTASDHETLAPLQSIHR